MGRDRPPGPPPRRRPRLLLVAPARRRRSQRPGLRPRRRPVGRPPSSGWPPSAPGVVDGDVRTEPRRVDPDARRRPRPPARRLRRPDGRARRRASACSSSPTRPLLLATRTPPTSGSLGLLTLFAGSMLGLVLADNLLVLYGFWELTSVTSFLLIGNRPRRRRRPAPPRCRPCSITGCRRRWRCWPGFIVLGQAAGTYRLSAHRSPTRRGGTAVTVALVLILLGAFTKSAQYPFHCWLPGAMVAPTPVSAYLHSATMVKAGVYLVARLAPGVRRRRRCGGRSSSPSASSTMIVGGLRALRQTDLKLLLAYGTVSQLGFMVAVFGWGTPAATTAGCVHAARPRRVQGGGVHGRRHPRPPARHPRHPPAAPPGAGLGRTVVVAAVAAASMAGVPLLFGFIAKEADFDGVRSTRAPGPAVALAGIVVGSALTVAYSLRFLAGVVGRLADDGPRGAAADRRPRPARPLFVAPGRRARRGHRRARRRCPRLLDASSARRPTPLDRRDRRPSTSPLWHGVQHSSCCCRSWRSPPASCCSSAAGRSAACWRSARCVPSSRPRLPASLRGLNVLANRVTGVAQPGSLPIYLGVILLTAAVVPGALLLSGTWWPGWPELVDVPVARADRRAADRRWPSPRRSCAGASPAPCSSAWSATRWPACSSSRARPTWR